MKKLSLILLAMAIAASLCAAPAMAAGYTPVLVFGSAGTGDGQFNQPYGIAVHSSGNIFVADSNNHRIQVFNSAGVYQSQFGTSGTGNGQFNLPRGIAIDSSGFIFVADYNNHRIQKFDSTGTYQSQFGSSGSGDGQFFRPIAVAFDSSDNIFVADMMNSRIQKFNSAGAYMSQFGTPGAGDGQFTYPDAVAFDSSGNIFVADMMSNRVQKFTSAGVYQSQFGTVGSGNGELNTPKGVAFDSAGNIFVADGNNNRIQQFTSAGGNYLSQFGIFGTGSGQFKSPSGIAIDSSDNIFVADTTNNRIQKWTPTFDVTFAAGANGNVTGTSPQTVNKGSNGTAVTAVPNAGYAFLNWTGTGGFVTSTANPLTVTNVTADMTITANFQVGPPPVTAGVSIVSVTNVKATTALATGTASGTGIGERGFFWWNDETYWGPNASGLIPAGYGAGDFSLTLTGLPIKTKLYVSAYIKVGGQTITAGAGNFITITTTDPMPPTVITKPDFTVNGNEILAKGEITDVGSSAVTIYGFVYAKHTSPTVWDMALPFTWDMTLPISQGKAFEGTTKNLSEGKYYFRAYAHNAQGTAYGEEFSFTITGGGVPGDLNGDGNVDLGDVIIALKILDGVPVADVSLKADVNGDCKIGMEEAIFVLQKVGMLR